MALYDGADVLYVNQGGGIFARANAGALLTAGFNNAGVWVDYNNDGFLGLFQSCGDSIPTRDLLYRNSLPQHGNTNHWLKLILKGTTSNASAIGARIRAQTGIYGRNTTQVRQVTTGCLAATPTDGMRPHFGLGDAATVGSLRIEWPSGTDQQLSNVPTDQILTIVEPRRPVLTVTAPGAGMLNGDPNRPYVAITEPSHGSDNLMAGTPFFRDPCACQEVRAVKKRGKWVLSGQKSAWVSNGPIASDAALFVNVDPKLGFAGGGIALVDLNQPGFSRGKPLNKMGQRELPQGEIFFDDVVCPEEHMIIDPESYEAITELTLGHANATMGAYFTGVAQAAFDLAIQYCLDRVQGGKPICGHQVVQRKLFDMFIAIETARAFSRNAMVFNMNTTPPLVQYSIASKVY